MNALLCVGAVMANAHHQVFCRPVLWATVVLVIAFAPLITYNLIRDRLGRFKSVVFFLFGIAACICLYCIVFLSYLSLFGLLSLVFIPFELLRNGHFGSPMALPLAGLPLFFSIQLLGIVFGRRAAGSDRTYFGMGAGLCVVFALLMTFWFNLHYATIRAAYSTGDTSAIPQNYMTERMLGMHFKYHLSFCPYDGWRPPLHDPSIVVAIWLTAPFRADMDYRGHTPWGYQHHSVIGRIEAYKAVFPDRPVRMECSCAKGYSKFYFNDPRLR
ncbi:MAG: hypothetical protein IPL77_07040 [Flavobacteriales bacterium]|nr:hypothetical protein [Flavobacteriales bacterium]